MSVWKTHSVAGRQTDNFYTILAQVIFKRFRFQKSHTKLYIYSMKLTVDLEMPLRFVTTMVDYLSETQVKQTRQSVFSTVKHYKRIWQLLKQLRFRKRTKESIYTFKKRLISSQDASCIQAHFLQTAIVFILYQRKDT